MLRKEGVPVGDPREVALNKRLRRKTSDYNYVLDSMKQLQRLLDAVLTP